MKVKVLYALVLASIVSFATGCSNDTRFTHQEVMATVIDKHKINAYSTPVYTGKTFTSIYHAAKYNIVLQYENHEETINNQDIYEACTIGDQVPVLLTKGYNSKGELKTIDFDIIYEPIEKDFEETNTVRPTAVSEFIQED